ncbi:SIR2 family protein [Acinetobacter ursingii]|uniref:SIR2 family protein n=1 Tax=Acinetobacter ursingii TaxID=108980 RepID=UPI0032B58968
MNTNNFLDSDSVIFILGAGASVDAKIPHASQMVINFEKILSDEKYAEEKELYLLLKSAILFQRGLKCFIPNFLVSIEDILNVIESLKQKQENILYPFIGNWSNQLVKTSGENFSLVDKLDELIRGSLYKWVAPENYNYSIYYNKIGELSKSLSFPIRVFSLNYDICVEEAFKKGNYILETGFHESTYKWSYERFESPLECNIDAYLYKLHGSINWKRNEQGELMRSDSVVENPQVIFGTIMKLRSLDPYLFSIYELRRWSLNKNLKFIVIVGYSFSDDHINKLIQQGLSNNQDLKLIVVDLSVDDNFKEKVRNSLKDAFNNLSVNSERIIYYKNTAKSFFEDLDKEYLKSYLDNDGLPF